MKGSFKLILAHPHFFASDGKAKSGSHSGDTGEWQMSDKEKDIGAGDARITDKISDFAERAAAAVSHAIHPMIEQYAQLFTHGARTPVLRRPDEYGMAYEEVFFPSLDGVPLEGWFIPAPSDKLIIANHPMPCNRYGFPGHLPPWNTWFGGFEVNFLPELKHLHDAGYNILTYDIRNHGMSGQGNGGIAGIGLLECRDVVGSLHYAKSRPDTASMRTGLYSRCMGGNSTIIAMAKWPKEFDHIQALFLLQPASGRTFIERGAENIKLDPKKAAKRLDERIHELSGFHLDEMSPTPSAGHVKVPTFLAQLRRDSIVNAEQDTQEIFDALGSQEKQLFWIEGSDQRFYAYNYFGEHPDLLVGWFDKHMNGAAESAQSEQRTLETA
jgi:hypothetical protein